MACVCFIDGLECNLVFMEGLKCCCSIGACHYGNISGSSLIAPQRLATHPGFHSSPFILHHSHRSPVIRPAPFCRSSAADADFPPQAHHSSTPLHLPQEPEKQSFWNDWQRNAARMKDQVAKLGLAAVLAYGLFDGITYTTFFVLAFLGYEKSTGKNPAANIQALLGIVILMWTGNNVTRPFRVAGAAALAPFIDKGLKKLQKVFNLPNQFYAFLAVVLTFASLCFSVIGLLILSRWGK